MKKPYTRFTVEGPIRDQINVGEAVVLGLLIYHPKTDILRLAIGTSADVELSTAILSKFGIKTK